MRIRSSLFEHSFYWWQIAVPFIEGWLFGAHLYRIYDALPVVLLIRNSV